MELQARTAGGIFSNHCNSTLLRPVDTSRQQSQLRIEQKWADSGSSSSMSSQKLHSKTPKVRKLDLGVEIGISCFVGVRRATR